MANPVGISIAIAPELDKLHGIIAEIGEKRSVFATKRAVDKTLRQSKTLTKKIIQSTLTMSPTKIKKEIHISTVPRAVKTLDGVAGSTFILERPTSAVGVRKTLIFGGRQLTSRLKKVVGVSVRWWKGKQPQVIKKAFVKRERGGSPLVKRQVWLRDGKPARGGSDGSHGIFGPKVSDAARFRSDEIVTFNKKTIARLLPVEFDSEMRNLTVKWSRRRR